ncbi:MAG: hypothetical protein ABI765_08035 [Gemmatimonadota bacterium]
MATKPAKTERTDEAATKDLPLPEDREVVGGGNMAQAIHDMKKGRLEHLRV